MLGKAAQVQFVCCLYMVCCMQQRHGCLKPASMLLGPRWLAASLDHPRPPRTRALIPAFHSFLDSVIEHSELGASAAIFAAGYTVDSLMFRYQVGWLQHDWAFESILTC